MALRHAYVKRRVSVRGVGRDATGVVKCIILILPFNLILFPSAIPLMKQVEKDYETD